MNNNKRLHLRGWRARVKVAKFQLISPAASAVCKNISAGGLLLETQEPLEVGQTIIFEMTLFGLQSFAEHNGQNPDLYKNDTLVGRAKVLRVLHARESPGGGWNTGVQFVNMPPETVQLLDKYITQKAGTIGPPL
jgi:hypothetical protein